MGIRFCNRNVCQTRRRNKYCSKNSQKTTVYDNTTDNNYSGYLRNYSFDDNDEYVEKDIYNKYLEASKNMTTTTNTTATTTAETTKQEESFVEKHPFITGIGALAILWAIASPDDDDNDKNNHRKKSDHKKNKEPHHKRK